MPRPRPRPLVTFKPLALLILGAGVLTTAPRIHAQTEQVVATVNGRAITQTDVDATISAQLLPLQEQIYALRRAALDNLILTKLLEDEAKKRGISVEELRRQLTAGRVDISPSQIEEEYLANAAAFAAMSPDEARERIRLALESQARIQQYREALARLKEAARLEIWLEAPKLPGVGADETAPARGRQDAAITIIEFSDFQCPFCRAAQSVLAQVFERYKNDVRLVFKHLPLAMHPQAFSSAEAAFCAGEQGFFWPYHDALFKAETLSPDALDQIAINLRLNLSAFKTCLNSETARAAVLKDVHAANRLGINSTPTFIINGKIVRGALGPEGFQSIIERELKSVPSGPRRP